MNNVYVVIDTDMGFIFGAYKSLRSVLAAAGEMLESCGYKSFIFEQDDEEWYITFPHEDPTCIGHWRIEHIKIED